MIKQMVLEQIEKEKIIVIARGVAAEKIIPFAKALYDGGIRLLEVTFDQTGHTTDRETAYKIRMLTDAFADTMFIGAGTVMTEQQVQLAHGAGARYIISPDVSRAVIQKTVQLGLVSIPGAVTPTEVQTAVNYGADLVKLFPAGDLGLGYIKSLMAPMRHVKLMAVGGINEKNLMDFLSLGLIGVGVGSSMTKKELLEQDDYQEIARQASLYTKQVLVCSCAKNRV